LVETMLRKSVLFILSLLFTCSLMGQETEISINAPGNVSTGVGFRVIYTVNAANGKFQPPAFDNSFTVSGPQVSTSRSTQWINGDYSSVSTTTYLYYLVANHEGTFSVPPAQYVMKNKTVSSSPLTITVSNSASQSSSSGTTGQKGNAGEEVYMRLQLKTRDVYVGEPVEASLKLYTRIQISMAGNGIAFPDFKGFLKEDIETAPLHNLDIETINGVEYGTGILQKFLLYPQISGDFNIDPLQIQVIVQQKSGLDDPFFGSSMFSSVVSVPRTVQSAPVTIHVKPLPADKPADFNGAVGRFELTSSLSKDTIQANDALTYTLKLTGSGNINLAGTPVFEVPATIEKYDPKISVNATSGAGGSTGSKTFEFLLIPRHSGEFLLPGISYTYFDISTGRYSTLKTPSHKIFVSTGTGGSNIETPLETTNREDVKYLGQDIRFIKTNSDRLRMKSNAAVENVTYYLAYLIILVLVICAVALLRQYIRRSADTVMTRNRKAAAVARKQLKNAEEYLNAKNFEAMNEAIAKGIWGYLSDKLLIPLSDLTRDKCLMILTEKGITPDLTSELDSIISSCEYSRFAPSSGNDSPAGLFERSEKLISTLENLL
jgi:hypothetical protein